MESPCQEGGELRRWRSLPVKQGLQGVSTIYRPEEYQGHGQPAGNLGGKEGESQRPPGPRPKPYGTFLSALLLATLITLAATAAVVSLLRAVHARYTPGTVVVPSTWTADMVVLGEFRVTNEPYRDTLSNMTSADFKQLALKMGQQLEDLFRESLMSDRFITASVIKFSPGLKVHCSLLLHPTDPLTVSKVGLAFLGGLEHAHGHLWLGPYIVDVQSIGFQASTEEVTWSQWSNWSECSGSGRGRWVRSRKRVCISLSGSPLKGPGACRDGSLQGISDTETELCPPVTAEQPTQHLSQGKDTKSENEDLMTLPPSTTTLPTLPPHSPRTTSSPLPPQNDSPVELVAPLKQTIDSFLNFTSNTTGLDEMRTCSDCLKGEVCVALEGELVPYCRQGLDSSDPTGCGGLCKINTEVCYRLREKAYRCMDDSKCLEDEWQCGNKLCIPLVKRCDGHFNCYDHTDEYGCDCNLKTHFHCGKNSSCLPKAKKCDGIVDCWDAADEVNCTVENEFLPLACLDSSQFTCNDSQCIPSKHFCDGFPDCNDKSDEPFGCGGVCKNHEWRCSNGRCIVRRDVCNGGDDCGDGSDEVKCGKRKNIL